MGQVLVITFVNGTIVALFALATALLFRGSRTINFALGEVGVLTAYIGVGLHTYQGLPWILAAVAAIAAAAVIGLVFEMAIASRLGPSDRVSAAVASIGLLSLCLAVEFLLFGPSPRSLEGPFGEGGVSIAGVIVSWTVLTAAAVLAIATVGLTAALRRTDFGLAVLAAAQDADAARLVGAPVTAASRFVWATAAGLGSLATLLVVPTITVVAPGVTGELFIKGIVAAVVGGLASPTGAVLGAFVICGAEAFLRKFAFADTSITGIELLILLAIVVTSLVLRPTGLLGGTRTRGAA